LNDALLRALAHPRPKNCADAYLGVLGNHVQRITRPQGPGSDHGSIRVSATEPHCFLQVLQWLLRWCALPEQVLH